MKYGFLGAILLAAFAVSATHAEDGRMTRSKLNNLGLADMQVATDAQGMEVRGQGRMFMSGAFISFAGPSSSSFTYGAQARGPKVFGIGAAQTVADYSVTTNDFFLSYTSTAFGQSFAFAP